jgi:hypothetical protein
MGNSRMEDTQTWARRVACLLFTCVTVCLLTSCGGPERGAAAIDTETPPALLMISEQAEGIIVAVRAQDWPRIYANIKHIEGVWQGYKSPTVAPPPEPRGYPAGMLFGQLDAALAALKYAAATRDAKGTMRAANDLSGAAVELIGHYNPARPSGINRLAVFQRQIVLDAADGDLADVSTNLSRVRSTWDRVRPAILANAGDTVVNGFDQLIAEQEAALQARNRAALTSSAETALRMINQMQELHYADPRGLAYR